MEATIQVHGGNGVLSGQLVNIYNILSRRHLEFGWHRCKSSFELDKQGNITSKDIMNFETKTSITLHFVIQWVMNVYTETIVLNVVKQYS